MSTLIPVVRSDAHLAHAGLVELVAGREVPCYESPERAIQIERALRADGSFAIAEAEEHGLDPILAVHEAALVEVVEHAWSDALAAGDADGSRALIPDTYLLAAYPGPMRLDGQPDGAHKRLGAFCFDTATPIVAGTAAAARAAVDVALTAAQRVVGGEPVGYGLCRPPGHHAARAMLGGYCFYNNAAIVAEWLRGEGGARRVAILDIDYHHGNGTQQIFWDRGDVLYVSLHADPAAAYPYFSGFAAETGGGEGAHLTRNLPLPPGTGLDGYAAALADALDLIAAFEPDAPLVLSLGFDTFERDPIGDLALRTTDYGEIGHMIGATGLPVIALQEGGYAVDAIGANAVAFLTALREGGVRP
ncbi:MAG TPA: histone deacetylase family protein [Candidatus Dormibacteraeota bacterium]|nr:histone deacetylase family protein [Candidatus Dormibacteraeota bacterium]